MCKGRSEQRPKLHQPHSHRVDLLARDATVPELLLVKGVDEANHEQLTVLERKELTAQQVHAALRMEGEEELGRGSQALFWPAVSCGLTLGLSLTAQGVLQHALPDASWRPLLASLGYSLGFIVLILARQELYTSNHADGRVAGPRFMAHRDAAESGSSHW